jgi:C1A family cysteine protease
MLGMAEHVYNLKRQHQDLRDFRHTMLLDPVDGVKLPKTVDLRPKLQFPIFDQGELGSCTANAGVAYKEYLLQDPKVALSRLYLYYKERELEGTINEDSGAEMREICKVLNQFGVCPEHDMPYNIGAFKSAPSTQAEADAAAYKIGAYHSVRTITEIKQALALRQRPVLIGIDVYESFESQTVARTGKVPLPNTTKEQALGGHAVLVVGYVDSAFSPYFSRLPVCKTSGYLIVRNSWGPNWGDKGYFYLPYEFVTKGVAYDFWVID